MFKQILSSNTIKKYEENCEKIMWLEGLTQKWQKQLHLGQERQLFGENLCQGNSNLDYRDWAWVAWNFVTYFGEKNWPQASRNHYSNEWCQQLMPGVWVLKDLFQVQIHVLGFEPRYSVTFWAQQVSNRVQFWLQKACIHDLHLQWEQLTLGIEMDSRVSVNTNMEYSDYYLLNWLPVL